MIKFLKQLISSNSTGLVSNTKFWYAVTMCTATLIILRYTFYGAVTEWMYWGYLAAGGATATLSKFIASKEGANGTGNSSISTQ